VGGSGLEAREGEYLADPDLDPDLGGGALLALCMVFGSRTGLGGFIPDCVGPARSGHATPFFCLKIHLKFILAEIHEFR
jgi:hypothetical protein